MFLFFQAQIFMLAHATEMTAKASFSLDTAPLHQKLVITNLICPIEAREWAQWLEEIGFLPGEPVRVVARVMPGASPLVVSVGPSFFALRNNEARCVQVRPI